MNTDRIELEREKLKSEAAIYQARVTKQLGRTGSDLSSATKMLAVLGFASVVAIISYKITKRLFLTKPKIKVVEREPVARAVEREAYGFWASLQDSLMHILRTGAVTAITGALKNTFDSVSDGVRSKRRKNALAQFIQDLFD